MRLIARCVILSTLAVVLSACQPLQMSRQNTDPPPSSATAISTQAARLDFRIAKTQPAGNLNELKLRAGSLYYVPTPLLSRADLTYVQPMRDQRGRPFVRFTLTEAGTKKLETLTRRNPGDWILFSMDDSFMGVTRIAGVVADGSLDIGMDSEQSARYVASKVGAAPQADNDATNRPNANNPGSLETVAPEIPARAGVR